MQGADAFLINVFSAGRAAGRGGGQLSYSTALTASSLHFAAPSGRVWDAVCCK